MTRRIPGLDGLRAASIVLVLIGHLAGTQHFLALDTVRHVGDLGNLGVRVFFIISGYLITRLLLEEIARTGGISLKGFYYRRTLRIFPAFYAFLGVAAILYWMGAIALGPGDLLHGVTYTMNYHPDRAWWVGHIWSLSVEEQFYLLWPATILLVGTGRAISGACALIVVAPLMRLTGLMLHPFWLDPVGESFLTVADTIATGCVAAAWGHTLLTRPAVGRALTGTWFWIVPVAAFGLNMYPGGRVSALVIETAINACIVLCVLRVAELKGDRVTAILDSRSAVFVGGLSYSIYLWQQPFLDRHSTALIASFPVNVLLVSGAAIASYYLIERPFLALRTRSANPPAPGGWRAQPARDVGRTNASAYPASIGVPADGARLGK